MRWLLLLLILLLFAPVPAEEGYPPTDSEVVVAGRMFESSRAALAFLHRLRALPWIRDGLGELEKALEIKLEGDFLDWMDGRVVLAVVRTDDRSPFHHLLGGEAEDPQRDIQFNLQTIYNAIEMYQLDKSNLPPDLESLVPDYLAALPARPEGVTYRLEPRDGGWIVTTTFQGAPGPTIDHENNLTPELAAEGFPHLNLVVAFRASDAARAKRAMGRLLPRLTNLPGITVEEVPAGGWDVSTLLFALAVRQSPHWLVFTDNPALAEPSLASLEGEAPSLTSNPRWQGIREHLPGSFRNWVFVDVSGIVTHWPGLKMEDRVLQQALESVQAIAGTTSYSKDVVVSDFFVRIDAPQDHPLGQLLAAPGPTELSLLRQAPWSTAYISVLDLNQSYDLVKRAAAINNDTNNAFQSMLMATDEALGLSFENDILPHSTGEIAITYEQLDVLYAAILQEWRRYTAPPVEIPEPSEPETTESEAPPPPGWVPEGEPPPEPMEDESDREEVVQETPVNLAEMPYTVVIGLRPGPARDEIFSRLKAKLGSKVRLEPHAGADILITADDQVAYAIYGNYLIVSTGGSHRLLRNTLDAMTGQVATLSRLNSYREFNGATRGRVLAAAHQKVDDIYSILKGVILLAGAEFRPEATALGRWRDAYSLLTIEEGGFRLRFGVYATEQIP